MRPYLLMLGGAFAFAVMGAFAHAAGKVCPWQVIALARSAVALVIAGSLAFYEQTPLVLFRPKTLWLRSLAGSLSVLCNFYALSKLPVADALTLTNMFPLWIAVLSWPMLGRLPGWSAWIGIVCGLLGVAVMQQPYLAEGNAGTLAAVTGSVTSAVALLGLHRLRTVAANAVVVHFSCVSVTMLLILLLVSPPQASDVWPLQLNWRLIGLLSGVGVTATIGQLLLTRAFAEGAPARVSVVGLSQVGFAMIFDIVIWNRQFHQHTVLGILLVLGPTVWMILFASSRKDEVQHQDHSDTAIPDKIAE